MRRLICCVVGLLWASGLPAWSGEISPFEVAFAEGIWAFSQQDSVSAVEHFEEALRLRPGDGFALYLLGLSHLRLGDAREAEQEIAASLEADPPPPIERSRILVDLGAAELAAGNAPVAVVTLDKALQELESDDPVRPVALHHQATALAAVGREKDAEAAREQARALDPSLDPEDLPITTPRVAEEARSGGGRPRWSGSVSLTADDDSNPHLLSEDLSLPIPPRNEIVDGRSSDRAGGAEIEVSYRPGRLPAGWSLGIDLRGGGSFHQGFDYLDVVRAGGAVRLEREWSRRWSVLLESGGEEILLDGSSYLRLLEAGAFLTFSSTEADATRVELRLLDRGYDADHRLADPRRDGEEVRIGLRQLRFLADGKHYVSLGIAVADRRADPAFERTSWEGEIRAVLPVGPRWDLDLSGWLREESFGDRSSNPFDPKGPARDDRTWGASAVLSYSLTERVQMLVRGTLTERNSSADLGLDLPDLDYRRTMLGTGVGWTF